MSIRFKSIVIFIFFIFFNAFHAFCMNIKKDKFLIVANGPLHNHEAIKKAACTRKVIALDGAADKLYSIGIIPDIILGDFDSIHSEKWGIKEFSNIENTSPPYKIVYKNKEITIIPAKNQNFTDLEKAIIYCDTCAPAEILIMNATGGRMDHSLGNIRLLRKFYNPNRPLKIITELQTLEMIKANKNSKKDTTFIIKGKKGDKCGIMAFPDASITTKGLTYDVTNYRLKFGFHESICNSLNGTEGTIKILKGEALVIYTS